MGEYTFIGDSIIESYIIDFEKHTISMTCVHWHGLDNTERGETKIVFEDVFTHLFVGINNRGNILFDIIETDVESLFHQFGDILIKYHFDFNSKEELYSIIQSKGYKTYLINSSFGLYGMVISKEIKFINEN